MADPDLTNLLRRLIYRVISDLDPNSKEFGDLVGALVDLNCLPASYSADDDRDLRELGVALELGFEVVAEWVSEQVPRQ